MQKLTDKEKLNEVDARIKKLVACNELFLDSLNQYLGEEIIDRYLLLCDWLDKYLYEINCIIHDEVL